MEKEQYALEAILSLVDKFSAPARGVQAQLTGMKAKMAGVAGAMGNLGGKFVDVGKVGAVALATGLTTVAVGIGAITKTALESADALQQNRIAFETMLGSGDKARVLLGQIEKFGLATPFTNKQLVESSKQLLAYGYEANEIIPTLKSLGDISAGIGMDKLPQLTLALGQVRAKTRLAGSEMLQFTNAGVPLREMLSKNLGVSIAKLDEMISKGQVGYKEVAKAMEGLASGRFKDLMQKQSKTLSGMISNFQDFKDKLVRTLGGITSEGDLIEGGLLDTFNTLLGGGLEWLSTHGEALTKKLEDIGFRLGSGIRAIKAVVTGDKEGLANALAFMFTGQDGSQEKFDEITNQVAGAIDKVSGVINTIREAFAKIPKKDMQEFTKIFLTLAGLNVALGALAFVFGLLTSPVAIVVGIIALLTITIMALRRVWDEHGGAIMEKVNAIRDAFIGVWEWLKNYVFPLFVELGMVVGAIMLVIWGRIKALYDAMVALNLFGILKAGIAVAWEYIKGVFTNLKLGFEIVSLLLQGRFDEVGEKWKKVMQNMKDTAVNIFNKIVDLAKEIFKGMGDGVKYGINTFVIDKFNGIFGKNIIPRLSVGTADWSGGLATINERGGRGETVYLPRHSRVVPEGRGGIGGITINVNAPVYGVDNLMGMITTGVKSALSEENKLARYNAQ